MVILIGILSSYRTDYNQFLIDKIYDDFKAVDNVDIIVMTDNKNHMGDHDFNFTWDELENDYRLNHFGRGRFQGNCVFPFLKLYNKYPNYDRYVFVEDDLLWTGDWNLLFGRMRVSSDYDVILPQKTTPGEGWWWIHDEKYYCTKRPLYKSMLQLYALSNDAIKYLDDELKKKICFGHHELLVNTLLINNNRLTKFYYNSVLPLNDIYIYEENLKDHPFIENHLYHPIKSMTTYKHHKK